MHWGPDNKLGNSCTGTNVLRACLSREGPTQVVSVHEAMQRVRSWVLGDAASREKPLGSRCAVGG